MDSIEIIGQNDLRQHLKSAISRGRIPQASLFLGKTGYGSLAIALEFMSEIFKTDNPEAYKKALRMKHVDMSLSFPFYSKGTTAEDSSWLFPDASSIILEDPYINFTEFAEKLGAAKKNIGITVLEIENIVRKMSLSSYEGGKKCVLIWGFEYVNTEAANKFLKFLEEPPADTYIILVSEQSDRILPTILSRCQLITIPPIENSALEIWASEQNFQNDQINQALLLASGDFGILKKILTNEKSEYEALFFSWMEAAFSIQIQLEAISKIIAVAKYIAGKDRKFQTAFLEYASDTFRAAFLASYNLQSIAGFATQNVDSWNILIQKTHGGNVPSILHEINTSSRHIALNIQGELVLIDCFFKITKYLLKKKTPQVEDASLPTFSAENK